MSKAQGKARVVKRVREAAHQLKVSRVVTETWEVELQEAVAELVTLHRGGLRDWARTIGISAQYACDIAHRRRKISGPVVSKILDAKAAIRAEGDA